MTRLRINYGINRTTKANGRTRIEHRCGKMAIVGKWLEQATFDKIRAIIKRRHPGWLITGFTPADKK